MSEADEPVLRRRKTAGSRGRSVRECIGALLARERFGVLCTQGEGQPYGSVVAVAVDAELRHVVFATARATRKYGLLSSCDRVALVVDDRDRHPDELMSVEALTATGRAREVTDEGDRACWKELLLARHPDLRGFVTAPSTAVFCVEIVRYLHVSKFQEVRQWLPPDHG